MVLCFSVINSEIIYIEMHAPIRTAVTAVTAVLIGACKSGADVEKESLL
jgi:hypothetical protein